MPITLLYKNKIQDAVSITENASISQYGTSYIYDGDTNSAYRGTTGYGTTAFLMDFGSAIYMDSICCITNLTASGTLVLRAGTLSTVADQAFGIPLDGFGTSYKYFGNNGYRYWRFDLYGNTAISKHQVNEISLSKRLIIDQMPSYPLENNVEEDTVELTSEKGQRWVYHNYQRENWTFNFDGVNAVTENELYKMYRYCGKNTTPFWMNLNLDDNANNIKFVRFADKGFLSEEITKNVYNITCEIESEL